MRSLCIGRMIAAARHSHRLAASGRSERLGQSWFSRCCGMQPTNLIPGHKLGSMLGSFDSQHPQARALQSASVCPGFSFQHEGDGAVASSSQQAAAASRTVTHRKASSSVSQRPARHLAPGWRADCLSSCGVLSGQGLRSHKTHLNSPMVPESATLRKKQAPERRSDKCCVCSTANPALLVVDSIEPAPTLTHFGRQYAPPACRHRP
jgi:hypothetical protein